MQLRVGFDIVYNCPVQTDMLMMLSLHPSQNHRLVTDNRMTVSPPLVMRPYLDSYGNLCHRVTVPAGDVRFACDFIVTADDQAESQPVGLAASPISEMPDDVLLFLLPSRYCEVDKLSNLAWEKFGHLTPGWTQVEAVLAYVHQHLRFDYKLARPDRSAVDAHQEQLAVCRDFAHLAITLLRAINIPARYATGWLGDIRWPRVPGPQDFSGWAQIWMAGRWWDVDARHVKPRHGRVLMGVGRDAADVALSTAFGEPTLTRFHIISDEVDPPAEWLSSNHEPRSLSIVAA
ncbi:transglutaminase-like domain-containing protein [Polymorphobacter sp.]|uniref:transglutaminase-like domain-containing protein n=1 Tax=Polymorphobacter sp. TaxID=1909290 RepID=UPI003F6E5DD8